MKKIKRALISVSDKKNLKPLLNCLKNIKSKLLAQAELIKRSKN